MVRLKVDGEGNEIVAYPNFNSYMVRLKVGATSSFDATNLFQFLYGAIKRVETNSRFILIQ